MIANPPVLDGMDSGNPHLTSFHIIHMTKHEYLKNKLATNVPEKLTIAKRVGSYPETDYNTKQPTGRMQTLYSFRMSTGEEVSHYAKEREEETLRLFNAGDVVVVTRRETTAKDGKRIYFLDWTAEGDASINSKPQLENNSAAVRTNPKKQRDYETEQSAHDWKLGIAGLLQAHIASGKSKTEARMAAVDDAAWVRFAAAKLATGEAPEPVSVPVPQIDYEPSIDPSDLPF